MSAVSSDVIHHHEEHPKGVTRWLFATNHKDIGTMYLWFRFDVLGRRRHGAGHPRRAVPARPAVRGRPEFFNQMTTMHGLIMVFGAIMPAFVGFANWMIPLQIGAPDMAFRA
jgi:cytochrome c oxidase subunit I